MIFLRTNGIGTQWTFKFSGSKPPSTHDSARLWGWRSPILDQRSLASLGHIAIYSLYPEFLYPFKKKHIDVEKSTICFSMSRPSGGSGGSGVPPLAKLHITYLARSGGANAWRSLVGGLRGLLQRRQDGAGLATRRSEGMQIGVISWGIGPLVGRFRADFRDFIGNFDEMIEMKFCIKL